MKFSSETSLEYGVQSEAELQLLLFVDKRSLAREHISQVSGYLETLETDFSIELNVVEVAEQPYLVEHYRLVATPALVRIRPEPRYVLAGSNLIAQLEECWPYWHSSLVSQTLTQTRTDLGASKTDPTIADATQRMQLSDEIFRLTQANAALRDQLNFQERMIVMLAHDLRNPLTATSLALETIMGQRTVDQPQNASLTPELLERLTQHAYTQTQIIERMITHLLEASQNNQEKLAIHPKKVELGPLCQEVILKLQNTSQQKSQILATDIPPDLPSVHADPDQVRQVVINLLDNAMKYTPEAGEICLSVVHRTTQGVQVTVCDNGLGIPMKDQDHIFDYRYRLTRDKGQSGYGIGLNLCKRIINAHYGKIWVDSASNRGSCFHFTLPVYR